MDNKIGASTTAVFTSDFHFGKLSSILTDDTRLLETEIRQPFDYAVKNGIPTVLIGGDISENPEMNNMDTSAFLRILMDYDKRLDIHIILGNHDVERQGVQSLYTLQTLIKGKRFRTVNVHEHPEHIQIGGIDFNMMPFPCVVKPKDVTAVNMAHLEWNSAMRDNGVSVVKGGFSVENTEDVWLMGHLHTHQYLTSHRVLYCGTLYQTSFGETSDKGFCTINVKKKEGLLRFTYKRIATQPKFRLINYKVQSIRDWNALSDNPTTLYKIWIKGDIPVPDDILVRYPNIVYLMGYKKETDIDAIDIGTNLTIEDRITEWLRVQLHTKKQMNQARRILQNMGLIQDT